MSNDYASLTDAEKKRPYAAYFTKPLAGPNPKLMAILEEGPMDPAKALPLDRLNDLLDDGYHEAETGYCVMKNGAGYVACNNTFPSCTVDMMKWWFSWHCLEDLRYKIWCPGLHGGISIGSSDRQKILDPNVPIDDKYANVVHLVTEDIGGGFSTIEIHFLKPEDIGFDTAKLARSPVKAVFGGYGFTKMPGRLGIKIPSIMIHTCREIAGGVEFRSRFYMGCLIKNRTPAKALPPFVRAPLETAKGLAFHNVVEYSNLASILPELYRDYGPGIGA